MKLFEKEDRRLSTWSALLAGAVVGIIAASALNANNIDPFWALAGVLVIGFLGVFVITSL